jgi:enamine deaminase RidA (YjgF/YER057c/UK114 family)
MNSLPAPPAPRGRYKPGLVHNGILYVSGQVSRDENDLALTGHLEAGSDLETAREAARMAMRRCLSIMADGPEGLDRIAQVLMVRCFIKSSPGFADHAKVMDAASDLLVSFLGERGTHARIALGVASLPSDGLIEIELQAALR